MRLFEPAQSLEMWDGRLSRAASKLERESEGERKDKRRQVCADIRRQRARHLLLAVLDRLGRRAKRAARAQQSCKLLSFQASYKLASLATYIVLLSFNGAQ